MAADDKDDKDPATPGFEPKAVKLGEESLADRILPHVKKILVMFILVAAVVSVVLMIRWRKHSKQEDATAKLGEVLDKARTPIEKDPKPEDKEPSFKSAKDRADAVLDAMAKAGAEGSASYKGGVLLDAGKYDEAIAAYRKGETIPDIEGVLCREGLGLALEAKAMADKTPDGRQKGLEEALAAFTAMQPEDAGQRRAHALYHMGRIQQLLGKTAEAKASYEKAKPLAAAAEPPSQEPSINHYQLSQLIERRLATM